MKEINRKSYWLVCPECKGNYWYDLIYCPFCWRKGKRIKSHDVKTCEGNAPANVARFNIAVPELQDGKTCFKCENSELSYCYHFGKLEYTCGDLASCACAPCCIKIKKQNEMLSKRKKGDENV